MSRHYYRGYINAAMSRGAVPQVRPDFSGTRSRDGPQSLAVDNGKDRARYGPRGRDHAHRARRGLAAVTHELVWHKLNELQTFIACLLTPAHVNTSGKDELRPGQLGAGTGAEEAGNVAGPVGLVAGAVAGAGVWPAGACV